MKQNSTQALSIAYSMTESCSLLYCSEQGTEFMRADTLLNTLLKHWAAGQSSVMLYSVKLSEGKLFSMLEVKPHELLIARLVLQS